LGCFCSPTVASSEKKRKFFVVPSPRLRSRLTALEQSATKSRRRKRKSSPLSPRGLCCLCVCARTDRHNVKKDNETGSNGNPSPWFFPPSSSSFLSVCSYL
jgi:hypothetical protein